MKLTKQQARLCLLAHQGLWPPRDLEGKSGILEFIRRVNCIQFDPINIVGQNPDLVLQSRVAGYVPKLLGELLYKERLLLDGWDKQMAIYPSEDWPNFQRIRRRTYDNLSRSKEAVMEVVPLVRDEIKERGPLSSIDLKIDGRVDWSWAPTSISRAAMESMYFWGELVIHHKVNTRRVYDFAHRLLSEDLLEALDPFNNDAAFRDWLVLRRLGAAGLLWNRSGEAWLGSSELQAKPRKEALTALLADGKAIELQVEGVSLPLYARRQDQARFEQVLEGEAPAPRAAVIAALDNLTWDRRLLKELFDFDYRWEVYKPAAQRTYGYYVLPVLYGERFVARFEPGREKKGGALVIKNWWWEDGIQPDEALKEALKECFQAFASSLGTDQLRVEEQASVKLGTWLQIERQ